MIKKHANKFYNDDAGFSLIEVAIALTVMGIVAGIAFPTLTHMLHMGKARVTDNHQEAVLTALALYALRTGQLPMPATSASHGESQKRSNIDGAADFIGEVPYATLGIARHYALDGFQQPLIYVRSSTHDKINQDELRTRRSPHNPTLKPAVNQQSQPAIQFCHTVPNATSTLKIINEYKSPAFIDQHDDFVAVVLLSRGEEVGSANPSITESANFDVNFEFRDQPYSTRQDSPHRHRLKWASRDFLVSHYGHMSCPAIRSKHKFNDNRLSKHQTDVLPVIPGGNNAPTDLDHNKIDYPQIMEDDNHYNQSEESNFEVQNLPTENYLNLDNTYPVDNANLFDPND